jgi:hypothetical protein
MNKNRHFIGGEIQNSVERQKWRDIQKCALQAIICCAEIMWHLGFQMIKLELQIWCFSGLYGSN